MVLSIDYSTEAVVIQRIIEAKQRFIKVNSEADDDETLIIIIIINPAAKRHFELQIKVLQNAPRDSDRLEQLLKRKERQNKEARDEIESYSWVLSQICLASCRTR